MNKDIDVYIKVYDEGKIPQYASKHAAGCDLYATVDMVLRPGETKIMPLNFIIAIDEDMEAQIRPRSGLSLKTELRIPNSPGTIDSDYRDPVGIIIQNTYNLAGLPYQIAQNPGILEDLCMNCREVELGEYLSANRAATGTFIEGGAAASITDRAKTATEALPGITRQKIYIDKNGNPYGTIYIKKGERIAQMVFCEYRRANFIPHSNPREIGEDRGGGFGHTGEK